MAQLDQATALRRSASRRSSSRTLAVVSGKGGVGKSTLAANLATSCAAKGARTLLVDGDAGLANADLLLGILPRFELADWCGGRIALEQALCPVPGGLELLVSGSGDDAARALVRAMTEGECELATRIDQSDLTILDLGAGIGRSVLDLASTCDAAWLVVTPEPTSLADAYAMARELWNRRPDAAIEVVINRAPDLETGERTYQALQRLTRRFVGREVSLRGVLLEDPAMLRAVARQVPVVRAEPRARISRQLDGLAESLVESATHRPRAVAAASPRANFLPG